MATVEQIIKGLVKTLARAIKFAPQGDKLIPYPADEVAEDRDGSSFDQTLFPHISYKTAMTLYGTDKPDLRIPFKVSYTSGPHSIYAVLTCSLQIDCVDNILPSDFIQKITKLDNPVVEAIIFRADRDLCPGGFSQKDLMEFMDSLPNALLANTDGGPAPLRFDPLQPLNGLSALGFEAAEKITALAEDRQEPLEQGDILIFQARRNKPFEGGSTALGRIRTALYEFALDKKLLQVDNSFQFLWVNEFPMFTPDNDKDPGQEVRLVSRQRTIHSQHLIVKRTSISCPPIPSAPGAPASTLWSMASNLVAEAGVSTLLRCKRISCEMCSR